VAGWSGPRILHDQGSYRETPQCAAAVVLVSPWTTSWLRSKGSRRAVSGAVFALICAAQTMNQMGSNTIVAAATISAHITTSTLSTPCRSERAVPQTAVDRLLSQTLVKGLGEVVCRGPHQTPARPCQRSDRVNEPATGN
jgi:hypothetical protein